MNIFKIKRIFFRKKTQEEFNQFFREILNKYKKNVKFNWGFYSYQILDDNGNWLFDVNYNPKFQWFLYSYDRILPLLKDKFGVNYYEINKLMMPVVRQDFKLVGITPVYQKINIFKQSETRL